MRSEAVFSASMEHIVIRWVIGFNLEQFSRIFVENNSESNQPSGEARSPGLPSSSPSFALIEPSLERKLPPFAVRGVTDGESGSNCLSGSA